MEFEHKDCPYKLSIEETEEGYAVHIKGDKDKIKAKLEALEAYHTFRQKAKAAGFDQCGSHAGHHGHHGFFSMIQKHLQAFHKHCQHSHHGHHGHHGHENKQD